MSVILCTSFNDSILWYRDGILQSHLNNSRELRITEVGWTSAIWTCAVFAEELEGELSLTSYQVRTVSFIVFFRDLLLPQYQVCNESGRSFNCMFIKRKLNITPVVKF